MPFVATLLCFALIVASRSDNPHPAHAIYLSTLSLIAPSADSQIAQLTVRVFSDDLRDAVRAAYPEAAGIQAATPDSLCASHQDFVNLYFNDHLLVAFDGDRHPVRLTTASTEGDVVTIEWEVKLPGRWTELTLSADYLMELFPEQSQMVTIRLGPQQRMFRLTRGKASKTMSL